MLVAADVTAFLEKESQNARKHVRKIGQILARIRDYGPSSLGNPEQFKREGRFPSGKASVGDIPVYAVKAFKLRVYGGMLKGAGEPTFVCIEAKKKTRNKADRKVLERVAKALGEMNHGN